MSQPGGAGDSPTHQHAGGSRRNYLTVTVTPVWLLTPPTVTTSGTAPDNPPGTTALTCITPATTPFTPPANCTFAGTPPIDTETGASGCGRGAASGSPSTPAGEVCPSPVA